MRDWLPWLLGVVIAVAAAGLAWARLGRSDGRPRPRRGPTAPPGRGRTGSRPGGATTAPPRPRRTAPTTVAPKAGEIWWADVPYADGTGSKVRPCLVLRAALGSAEVLKITSQDKSDRDDHLRIPTKSWDRSADHDSWLDVSDPIRVELAAFEDRAGDCDPAVWQRVRQVHGSRGRA